MITYAELLVATAGSGWLVPAGTLEKGGPLLAAGFAQERLDELQPADATPEDPPG